MRRPGPFRIKEPEPYRPWVAVVIDATSAVSERARGGGDLSEVAE